MRRFRSHWEDDLWKVLRILELTNVVFVVSMLGFVLLGDTWAKVPLAVTVIINAILAGLVLWRSWVLGGAETLSDD